MERAAKIPKVYTDDGIFPSTYGIREHIKQEVW